MVIVVDMVDEMSLLKWLLLVTLLWCSLLLLWLERVIIIIVVAVDH